MSKALESILRHDRKVVAASLLLVTITCWIWIFSGAGMGMSGIEMTRHSQMSMDMMPAPIWNASFVLLMFFMWWIMMIAMMLPSATPVILLATALNRRTEASKKPFGSTVSFTTGYVLVWAVFSAMAVLAQWALQESGLISNMLASKSDVLSTGLLVIAGAWQFTSLKNACLRHCRGPVEFLTQNRRKGNFGAILTGAHHGLYCLGCCWFLMALLFVGGVMNLYWIAGLAIYVWVEKVIPTGEIVGKVMGGLLIVWGIGILLFPSMV
jgi:predicted metal-binding membrane protein